MDELELIKIIDSKIENGIGGNEGDISQVRQEIFDRYMGELYGNEKEGSSKVTTREVFETVEWAMPSIVRVFESGDRVIEFDATSPEDEAGAEQETDAVNHVYQKDNNGFIVTHNIIKSALLNPNSYVKVYRDEREEVETENYENLSIEDIALLTADETVEITGQELNSYGLYDIELKRTCKRGKNKVQVIPEDEVVIDSNHAELTLDECEFVCHKPQKTKSDLTLMGYDVERLKYIGPDEEYTSEETNRNFYADENDYDDDLDDSLKKFTVYECYMLVDWDGDGIAERRRVVKIGNEIFENEELDMMPMESAASIIIPHKHTGMSLSQSIIDLQEVKTFFMRQTITNMAKVNNPRTVINANANLSDVLSNRSNGVLRVKGNADPRASVATEPTQPIIGQVLPLLELLDSQKEGRSGITRNSMGLDADILAKSTEGAFMGAIEKAEQRVEFIVRVFAETVFKGIFLKLHHLILSHGDTKWMKLNGQWVQVDPSEWKKRESMTVNVGLGLGSKNQKMAAARVIIAEQDKIMQMGGMGQMVSAQNLYNARRLLTESAGEKNVDKYFINPAMQPPQPPAPPQPDLNMLMIQSNERIEQGKYQAKMAEIQQKGQIEYAKFQFEQAESARKQQFEQVELSYQQQIDGLTAQITQSKNQDDAAVKELQAQVKQLEVQLKDAQEDERLAMDKYKADLDAQTKLTIKEMDVADHVTPIIEERQKEVDQALSSVAQLISDMNQPKEIVRDDDGNPVGVRNVGTGQVRTIIKDNEGLPIGLE